VPKIDVEKAVGEFRSRIEDDYYPVDRSINREEDYQQEKELRDTEAVINFVKTSYFAHVKNME